MCLGRTHTIGGACAALAVAGVERTFGWDIVPEVVYTAPLILASAVLSSGAAQLPDADCPGSAISRALGPVTMTLSRMVACLVRRHRGPTHYLVAVPVFALVAWAFSELRAGVFQWPVRAAAGIAGMVGASTGGETGVWWTFRASELGGLADRLAGSWADVRWGMFALLALLASWGFRMLSEDLDHALLGAGEIVAGVGFAWWVTATLEPGRWVFASVAIGVLAHDLADLPTKGPFRFLWPLPWKMAFGWFRTGQRVENWVVAPLLTVVALVLAGYLVVLPAWAARPMLANLP